MNKIDRTAKIRILVGNHIDANLTRLIKMKSELEQSGFSDKIKQGYVELIDKKLQQLKEVQFHLSKSDKNTYKDFVMVEQQTRRCIAVVQDINHIDAHFRTKLVNQKQTDLSLTLPDAPTHRISINKSSATPTTVPAATLEKIVVINSKLSEVKGSIDKLVSMLPNKTTEEKVHRSATYQMLHKQQEAFQSELDGIGKSLHKRNTPLTTQQTASIHQKLATLEQKIVAFCNQISAKVLANAPKAPTGGLKPPSDDEPTIRGPRR